MSRLRTAVVVGNPRPGSRTLATANLLARELTGARPDLVVDLAELGGTLLDPRDEAVDQLIADVATADLVVVASPTYKATYTGLLKVFLDRFGPGQLSGLAIPLMLGAGPGHQLAPEVSLRPLLVELGAVVPWPGLYVLDQYYDDPAVLEQWLGRARPVLTSLHRADGVAA